ncbi:hypothetical protein [Flavihumibacter profundi]|uniref:hypothetical protein n=1 Tax=Flavihumibacter profundi TaxID=2716883 RepID=UPI001CC5EA3A|nr:hypothetical protein [Flavihumibacter profundi]MBZ5857267.1 hypothetical protein [Flavihumibacter profundi]
MFTSKQELSGAMGVDPEIAAFFVDRKIPAGNQYWKGKYLYVARGTGFLFIPLFFDLQLRAGIDRKILLDESYVQLMEKILDFAAQYELKKMDFEAHIGFIEELVRAKSVQPELLENLSTYFKQRPLDAYGILGTGIPAMNRGDALLYLLTVLDAHADIIKKIIAYWYLLVPSFLLLDDIMDLQEDQDNQEENSLSHFGYDTEGVRKAIDLLDNNFAAISAVNPLLGNFFRSMLDQKKQSTYFQLILNEK